MAAGFFDWLLLTMGDAFHFVSRSCEYQVDQIIMVDDYPEKLARQPRNHIAIALFTGQQDVELVGLMEDLIHRALASK